MRQIAALFVAPYGPYFDRDGIDAWDESRDARTYAGDLPVVAHPPCQLWVNMAAVNWKRYGRQLPAWYPGGSDGGCFASALRSVSRCGGVLEHPASSHAWPHTSCLHRKGSVGRSTARVSASVYGCARCGNLPMVTPRASALGYSIRASSRPPNSIGRATRAPIRSAGSIARSPRCPSATPWSPRPRSPTRCSRWRVCPKVTQSHKKRRDGLAQ
jgi:hypothetical protein